MIWEYGETLTLEYADTPLTQFRTRYQPDKRHFHSVTDARRFTTPYASAQAPLWEPGAVEWRLAWRLPDYVPRQRHKRLVEDVQPPLLEDPTEQPG